MSELLSVNELSLGDIFSRVDIPGDHKWIVYKIELSYIYVRLISDDGYVRTRLESSDDEKYIKIA